MQEFPKVEEEKKRYFLLSGDINDPDIKEFSNLEEVKAKKEEIVKEGGNAYYYDGNTVLNNNFGNETETTFAEAYDSKELQIAGDESHGMQGTPYIVE